MRYKANKEQIIPDALSRFASANTPYANLYHSKFDALFTYNTMLVKIYLFLISQILEDRPMVNIVIVIDSDQ